MSWSYSSGTLTASGGSETSPNLISDGVETVIASDSSKGDIVYEKDGSTVEVCKLIDVEVVADIGSWIGIDQDVSFVLEGSSHFTWTAESSNNANDGGSLIMQERSTIYVNTGTSYTESTTRFNNGCSCVIKQDDFGVNPRIVLHNTARHDIITFPGQAANKVDITGLNIHQIGGSNSSLKWFMNYCRNIVNFKNITFDATGEVFQLIYVSIDNPKVKTTGLASTSRTGTYRYTYINNPTYIWSSNDGFDGNIRSMRAVIKNPVWSNGNWDGTVNWGAINHSNEPRFWIVYENTVKTKKASDASDLDGVKLYFKRSVEGTDYYSGNTTDHSDEYTETVSGGEVTKELLDAYCSVTDGSNEVDDVERYSWSLQARHYNYLYVSQYVYQSRRYGNDLSSGTGKQTDTVFMTSDDGVTSSESTASGLTKASNFSDVYDIVKVSWIDSTHWDIDMPVVRSGSSLDFGSNTIELDSTASSVFSISGSIVTIKSDASIATSSKYDQITANEIKFNSTDIPDNSTYTGDVYIDSEQNLSSVTITGDLHINTGANSTLDFDTVTVSGNVYNDDASHTLTINLVNSSMTAGDPGTGNGQTNLKNSVNVKVTVVDKNGTAIQGAMVYIEDSSSNEILKDTTDSSGEVSTTYEYTSDENITGRARKASSSPYYKTGDFSGTITNNGFSTKVILLKDE